MQAGSCLVSPGVGGEGEERQDWGKVQTSRESVISHADSDHQPKISGSTARLAAPVWGKHLVYVLSCCLRGPFGTQGSTPISFSVKCRELGVGTAVTSSSGGLQPAASSCSEDPQVRTEFFTGACLRHSGWPPPKEHFLRNPSPGVTRTPGLCCPHN